MINNGISKLVMGNGNIISKGFNDINELMPLIIYSNASRKENANN